MNWVTPCVNSWPITSSDFVKSSEDLAVPVSVRHLGAIPEGVVVVHAVVNRRHQRHAGIVNRVPSEALPIEIDDIAGGIERAFRCTVLAVTGIRRPASRAVIECFCSRKPLPPGQARAHPQPEDW